MEEENPSSSLSTTNIKLIIKKGQKEVEAIESKSNKLIKIGRVLRGNTYQIKDSGISTHHISIHFDDKWMLTDLDSSNGTFLNAQQLQPNVATALTHGDCIEIGKITSIIVNIGMVSEPLVELRRNPGRQARSKPVFPEIGKNLRGRAKKTVVESVTSKKVNEVPDLCKIPEEETTDVFIAAELKNTRGGKKKLFPVDQNLAEAVPVIGRRTRRGRMAVAVETLKNVESGGIEENVNNETAQDQVVLTEEGRDGKESVTGGSPVKSSPKVADADKGKKVADELESRQDGSEGSWNKTEPLVELRRNPRRQARSRPVFPDLCKIPEEGTTNVVIAVEPKNTRVGKKKLFSVDQKLAEAVPAVGRRTRRRRLAVAVETLKNIESGGIEENVTNETAQDQVVEKLVLIEDGRDGKESVTGGSSVKSSSKVAGIDKGKKVAEELESRQDGAEGSRNKTEPDSRKWDLEKMTLGDFFDYMKEQLTKEIIDETEKIIADLKEKARQCYRQRYENGKGKHATN